MAKVENMEKGTQVQNVETQDEEELRYMYKSLKSDFQKLNDAINFSEENPKKLALLLNSRQRIAMTIFTCMSLMRDPKLKITSDSGRKKDLARLIQKTLLKNSPVVEKLVSESEEKVPQTQEHK